MSRLSEHNIKINFEKSEFLVNEVKYLGHVLTSEGIKTCKDKVEAILGAPPPENKFQLKSFLGMINFYGKFLPNLSTELHEMYELLKENKKFTWNEGCSKAFRRCKELLASDQILVNYDPKKPLVITCDASPYGDGVGAVLAHVVGNTERPIMYASSSLNASERNYAQLHREALAVVWSMKKFHKYVYEREVTVYSDHQPLKDIFSSIKGSPPVAAARVHSFNLSEELPLDKEDIASKLDIEIERVYQLVWMGWPDKTETNIQCYFAKRNSLSTEGCLFYGERVLIPRSLRSKVMALLHETHVGIVRMKILAR